jgi:hypothetical protein
MHLDAPAGRMGRQRPETPRQETAMPALAHVHHTQWIAAPLATVRSQFGDLDHHIGCNVHPKLRFEVLERRADGARFVQVVRLLGIAQRGYPRLVA